MRVISPSPAQPIRQKRRTNVDIVSRPDAHLIDDRQRKVWKLWPQQHAQRFAKILLGHQQQRTGIGKAGDKRQQGVNYGQ